MFALVLFFTLAGYAGLLYAFAEIALLPGGSQPGLCRGCGYELAGLPAGVRCPECGVERPDDSYLARLGMEADRRRPWLAMAAPVPAAGIMILLVAAPAGFDWSITNVSWWLSSSLLAIAPFVFIGLFADWASRKLSRGETFVLSLSGTLPAFAVHAGTVLAAAFAGVGRLGTAVLLAPVFAVGAAGFGLAIPIVLAARRRGKWGGP